MNYGEILLKTGVFPFLLFRSNYYCEIIIAIRQESYQTFCYGNRQSPGRRHFYSLEAPVKFAIILLGIWIAIHRLVYPDSL